MDDKQDHLTHVGPSGQPRMVDVGEKEVTRRVASARCQCSMLPSTRLAIQSDGLAKGAVLQVAKIAAIGAAKRTDELIPLCHSIPIEGVDVNFSWESTGELVIDVTVRAQGKTGIEMEAMVAASIAGLTVYDMCKAVDREMRLSTVELRYKSGGKSGEFTRE